MITVHAASQQQEWNTLLTTQTGEHTSFLHAWEWGTVQERVGRSVTRFIVKEDGEMRALVCCVVVPLPLGRTYLFSHRGPVFHPSVSDAAPYYDAFLANEAVRALMQQRRVVFWRFEPLDARSEAFVQRCKRVKDVEPGRTQLIDLSLTEDVLLSQMSMRARYNVRLAAKKGVRIEWVARGEGSANAQPNWEQLTEQFWELITETSQRHHFRSHSKAYYQSIMEELGTAGLLELCLAFHEKELLAMNMMVSVGDIMTYLHSGATRAKSQLKAPHLMQWECMKRAKQRGLRWYDLYGIAPDEAQISAHTGTHPLSGVTAFKQGLGGAAFVFPGTFEYPVASGWYSLYRMAKRLRF